jgi:hypothetical protein
MFFSLITIVPGRIKVPRIIQLLVRAILYNVLRATDLSSRELLTTALPHRAILRIKDKMLTITAAHGYLLHASNNKISIRMFPSIQASNTKLRERLAENNILIPILLRDN